MNFIREHKEYLLHVMGWKSYALQIHTGSSMRYAIISPTHWLLYELLIQYADKLYGPEMQGKYVIDSSFLLLKPTMNNIYL